MSNGEKPFMIMFDGLMIQQMVGVPEFQLATANDSSFFPVFAATIIVQAESQLC